MTQFSFSQPHIFLKIQYNFNIVLQSIIQSSGTDFLSLNNKNLSPKTVSTKNRSINCVFSIYGTLCHCWDQHLPAERKLRILRGYLVVGRWQDQAGSDHCGLNFSSLYYVYWLCVYISYLRMFHLQNEASPNSRDYYGFRMP